MEHVTVDIRYPSLNDDPDEGTALIRHQQQEGKKEEENVNFFKRLYRNYFKSEDGDSYVDTLLKLNAFLRALKFFPALFITFAIELGNSFVLGHNQDILSKHFTLVLFIPVISAIAGNIGLQTSSSVTSFLNLRMIDKKPYSVMSLTWKYVAHCFFQMIVLSVIMGALADVWKKEDICRHSHGIIILFGSMVNMLIASIAGVGTPIILNHFGYDPSSGAGPFETALQDVVGAIFFVYFAKWILSMRLMGCIL